MAEQCAFYVRCDRCQYGRNLGSNEYGCRKHLAPDGKTIHQGQYSCENGREKEWTLKKSERRKENCQNGFTISVKMPSVVHGAASKTRERSAVKCFARNVMKICLNTGRKPPENAICGTKAIRCAHGVASKTPTLLAVEHTAMSAQSVKGFGKD